MAFTNPKVRAMKPKESRYISWEDGSTGLGVRVSPQDRKTFIFMYRHEGKSRMMTVGPYPRITLAEARVRVANAKEKLSRGVDPGSEWVKSKKANREAPTVDDLVEVYLEKWARPRKKSAAEDERILRKDVLPLWGRRKAKAVKRRDVILLLDNIVGRGAPIAANRTFAVIRKMFRFALSRDLVETSPCEAVVAPGKETRRDRVLSENEIKAFWLGLDKAQITEGLKFVLKLQLATAQRRGEVVGAEWSEFDMDSRFWTIPAEKSKNGLPHRVPLSPLVLDLLEDLKKLSGESRWLFPSRGPKDSPLFPSSVVHAITRNMDVFKVEHFTPHDLRRTAASHMTSIGISRLVVAKILNHAESGVTAVYDRHSYDNEKRQALNAWSRKLESIVSGEMERGKVIDLVKK